MSMIVQLMLQIFKISWVHEDRQSYLDSIPHGCFFFSHVMIVAASPDLSLAIALSTSPRPDWMISTSDIQFELATPNRAVTDRLTGVSGIWGR